MGLISVASAPLVYEPAQEIYVQGVRRVDARIESLTQSSGGEPSLLRMAFPLAGLGRAAARDQDKVVVYLDRHLNPAPKFVGRIVGSPDVAFGAREPTTLAYTAADLRHFLADAYCDRDYNRASRVDGSIEGRMSSRQIVVDLYKQYYAHQSSFRNSADILGLELSRFPDQVVGEFAVRGEPHASALQRLVETLGDGSYRLYIRYQANAQATLSCYKAGQGHQQFAVVGSRPLSSADNQPYGQANVGRGSSANNSAAVVNEVVVESRAWMRERAVALGPKFDVARLDELSNLLAAQIEPGPSVENPSYDPSASEFGRVWEIPKQVDADGVERLLEIQPDLLQAQQEDPYFKERPHGPALIYRFGDEDSWKIIHRGFSISDNAKVETDFPLIDLVEGEEAATIDRPILLDKLEAKFLPGGGVGLFYRNATPTSFNLADWASGAKEVRSEGSGGGVVAAVREGDPGDSDDIRGAVYVNSATGIIWLGQNVYPPFIGDLDLDLASEAFWPALASLRQFRAAVYLRDTREIDPEAPSARVFTLPTEVYLQATFLSVVPLSASSGRRGSSRAYVKRLSTSGAAAKHVAANWFKLEAASAAFGDYAATQTDWDEAGWSGESITTLRDDSAWLQKEAVNQALTLAEARLTVSRSMPRMPTHYQIGKLLNENGSILGNIVQITYDFKGRETLLEVSSQ